LQSRASPVKREPKSAETSMVMSEEPRRQPARAKRTARTTQEVEATLVFFVPCPPERAVCCVCSLANRSMRAEMNPKPRASRASLPRRQPRRQHVQGSRSHRCHRRRPW
jgi:hypothetical protein